MRTSCKKPLGGAIGQKAQPATIDRPCQTAEAVTVNKGARAQVRASTLLQAGWDSLGCLSVIGRTSRLPCCPRSRIASLARYAREAHPEGPIGLRPREGPPIAGLEVLFASREYAPPPVPFPARKPAARSKKGRHSRVGAAAPSLGVKRPNEETWQNPCLGEPFTCTFRAAHLQCRAAWLVFRDGHHMDSPQIPDSPAGFLESRRGL
jgi:hypothetical protein